MIPGKKSPWQKIKNFFTNIWATTLLGLGIVITAGGIAVAIILSPLAFGPVLIAALGSFIGAFVVIGALHRFVDTPSGDTDKLAEAEAAVREAQREKLEISRDLEKEKAENEKLQHRLATFANVTQIQPVMKLIPGEFTFDITDFCEKRLDEDKPEQHFLSGNYHVNPEFYRGVCRRYGKMNLAVDLAAIKVIETEKEITICGPFEYERSLGLDSKFEWLMRGRREQEFRHGHSKSAMDTYKIEITQTCDTRHEEEQRAALEENLKNLKIVDSMKNFTDKIVAEFVKILLAPTGKVITCSPTIPKGCTTKTLSELIAAHNQKILTIPPSGNGENKQLENTTAEVEQA